MKPDDILHCDPQRSLAMSHWAKPGVKCLCVDVNPSWKGVVAITPRTGVVYTIREVVDGRTAILLVEIKNHSGWFIEDIGRIGEPCFGIWRFRPLITRTQEQDIELFTPLLDVRNHDEWEREFQ